MLPCSIAWCELDLSSPECGRFFREPRRMGLLLVRLEVAAVAIPAATLVELVALAEVLEDLGGPEVAAQGQLGVALGFALDLGRLYGHVVELWSQ